MERTEAYEIVCGGDFFIRSAAVRTVVIRSPYSPINLHLADRGRAQSTAEQPGCPRVVQGMFKGRLRDVHGKTMGCLRDAQGMFKGCPWDVSMGCPRELNGMSKGCPRDV